MLARICLAFVVAVALAVVYTAASGLLLGSVPDEASLRQVAGRLGDVRIADGPDASISFTVTPPQGAPLSLHIRPFGKTRLAEAVARAEGRSVTVRYKSLLLGNPAYEIRSDDMPLLSYAEAAAALRAEDERSTPERWRALALYVGLPFALWATFALVRRRRAAAAGVATSSIIEGPAQAARKRNLFVGVVFAALVLILVSRGFTEPAMVRPVVGVFGDRPFGLPNEVAATLCLLVGLTPLAPLLRHLAALSSRLSALDGKFRRGWLSLVLGAYKHRSDALARRSAAGMILWLGAFMAIAGAWIWAAARAGV